MMREKTAEQEKLMDLVRNLLLLAFVALVSGQDIMNSAVGAQSMEELMGGNVDVLEFNAPPIPPPSNVVRPARLNPTLNQSPMPERTGERVITDIPEAKATPKQQVFKPFEYPSFRNQAYRSGRFDLHRNLTQAIRSIFPPSTTQKAEQTSLQQVLRHSQSLMLSLREKSQSVTAKLSNLLQKTSQLDACAEGAHTSLPIGHALQSLALLNRETRTMLTSAFALEESHSDSLPCSIN